MGGARSSITMELSDASPSVLHSYRSLGAPSSAGNHCRASRAAVDSYGKSLWRRQSLELAQERYREHEREDR